MILLQEIFVPDDATSWFIKQGILGVISLLGIIYLIYRIKKDADERDKLKLETETLRKEIKEDDRLKDAEIKDLNTLFEEKLECKENKIREMELKYVEKVHDIVDLQQKINDEKTENNNKIVEVLKENQEILKKFIKN